MSFSLALILSCYFLSVSGFIFEWCDFSLTHTMCQYHGPASACQPLYKSGLSAAEKKEVLHAHNKYRAMVANGRVPGQPSAANMEEMEYNEEIAEIAQMWAIQCERLADSERRTLDFKYVGQNVIQTRVDIRGNDVANWTVAVDAMYKDVTEFRKENISPFKWVQGVGLYTQVVWAKSSKLGCGYSSFRTIGTIPGTRIPDIWYRKNYICNYAPAGNILGVGQEVYIVGKPASQCPNGESIKYEGLCRPSLID